MRHFPSLFNSFALALFVYFFLLWSALAVLWGSHLVSPSSCLLPNTVVWLTVMVWLAAGSTWWCWRAKKGEGRKEGVQMLLIYSGSLSFHTCQFASMCNSSAVIIHPALNSLRLDYMQDQVESVWQAPASRDGMLRILTYLEICHKKDRKWTLKYLKTLGFL